MKRRKSRPRRPPPELHRGPWQPIPRVEGGAEEEFTIREGVRRRLPRGRHLVVFAIAFLGAALWTAFFAWPRIHSLFEILGAIGVVGRGFAVVVGGLGLICAVGYYYTAGIDWPRETAGRILVIAAILGASIVAAIGGLAFLEGRLAELWPLAWKAGLALVLLGLLGIMVQRR